MCTTDWEECTCECHASEGLMSHCSPCCLICPFCLKKIRIDNFDFHIQVHEEKSDKRLSDDEISIRLYLQKHPEAYKLLGLEDGS